MNATFMIANFYICRSYDQKSNILIFTKHGVDGGEEAKGELADPRFTYKSGC